MKIRVSCFNDMRVRRAAIIASYPFVAFLRLVYDSMIGITIIVGGQGDLMLNAAKVWRGEKVDG